MSKIRCIVVDDEPVAREILETFVSKTPQLELVKSCEHAMDALEVVQNEIVDVCFLDINMPDINGISLAKLIANKAQIIFTTAYRDYAIDGFELQAVDYLLKPIAFDRFLQAVQRIVIQPQIEKQLEEENNANSDFMFVRSERKMVKVKFDAILYLESLGDYVKIFTSERSIITRDSIANVSLKLPKTEFLRIHRSYVVAINAIESYTNEYIEIQKKALPISRSYKETVLQKLAEV